MAAFVMTDDLRISSVIFQQSTLVNRGFLKGFEVCCDQLTRIWGLIDPRSFEAIIGRIGAPRIVAGWTGRIFAAEPGLPPRRCASFQTRQVRRGTLALPKFDSDFRADAR
jgi:hypothetical protein